jgi:hypothetical protein
VLVGPHLRVRPARSHQQDVVVPLVDEPVGDLLDLGAQRQEAFRLGDELGFVEGQQRVHGDDFLWGLFRTGRRVP